jgi:hypothetical protein
MTGENQKKRTAEKRGVRQWAMLSFAGGTMSRTGTHKTGNYGLVCSMQALKRTEKLWL